ncbi:thioesterase II family protein [Steroidobacter flavus]|uniref:Thioesterase II family protein n=1 Tax=Steroidobacter flavus TaxID=1842136 RepID=A0ABV8T313_9GAMM
MRTPLALLCLPCAGASASMYLRWQRLVPAWLSIVPIELPGRGTRTAEPAADSFETLIDDLCRQHQHRCNERYALFGHSMGALLAYSMAVRWRTQQRQSPELLFVSASPAPRWREPAYFADKQTDASLIAELRTQGGTPAEVFEDAELLAITLDTLRTDYRICAGFRYRPTAPLDVAIHALAGRRDRIGEERILAWQTETRRRFDAWWFEGGHFFIREHESSVLRTLIHALSGDLREECDVTVASV